MKAIKDSSSMPTRTDLVFASVLAAMLGVGCDSGLEGVNGLTAASLGRQAVPSANLRTTLDTCLAMSDSIGELDIAGGVVPSDNGGPGRAIAFVAFTTNVRSDDADGDQATVDPLDADGTPEANTGSDIFIAALDASEIDPRDFVYSIQGTMRHPRCVTCHSMNAADSVAFSSAPGGHISNQPPLEDVEAEQCSQCHEVSDWRSPPPNFDLRANASVTLFARAKSPIDVTPENLDGAQHFKGDPRVRWALESGILPFGNVADDDHDGIAEPSDTDGVIRTVPGGGIAFDRRLDAWLNTGRGPLNGPVNKDDLRFDSAADALQEIVLVSRNSKGDATGNGSSSQPSIVFVSNPNFTPTNRLPVGTLVIAFTSESTDMAGGGFKKDSAFGGGSSSQVYRVELQVRLLTNGSGLDLQYVPSSQELISASAFGGGGNANSSAPNVGDWGRLVAFESEATNLALNLIDDNGDRDVFVRDVVSGSTYLVSHVSGDIITAGNGASGNPDLSPFGNAVAFESEATNLVPGDSNGERDVFYAVDPSYEPLRASVRSDGSQASGGASRNASIASMPGSSDYRIAFESDKTDLVDRLPTSWSTNVYLHNSANGGQTTLLNKIEGPDGERLPRATGADGLSQPVGAFKPAISPDGQFVLFESNASNLDFVRPFDENGDLDVFLSDLQLIDNPGGFVLPYAVSVNPDGGGSNGRSFAPRVGAFDPPTDDFPLGLSIFRTTATNLGNMDPGDLSGNNLIDGDESNAIVTFLREGAAVVAHFEADNVRTAAGTPVAFEDQSSGRPSEFQWDFGDGAPLALEQNPVHVYEGKGSYTVELTVKSGQFGSDTRKREAFIRVLGPVQARFGANPTIGAVALGNSLSIQFNDMSEEIPEVWSWQRRRIDTSIPEVLTEFSTEQNPTADFERGIYEVVLEAEGLGGRGLSTTTTIEVYTSVISAFQSDPDPAEGFSTLEDPLIVTFTDMSTGDVDSIAWDFGGGLSLSAQGAPTQLVEFPPGPPYTVRLQTVGRGGDVATRTGMVRAIGNLSSDFSGLPVERILNFGSTVSVDFSNGTSVSGDDPATLFYRWERDGSTFSTAFDPPNQSFGLANADALVRYDVSLVASLISPVPAICELPVCSERTRSLTIYPALQKPTLSFNAVPVPASKPPHTVKFNANVIGDGAGTDAKYEWLRSPRNGTTANMLFSTSPNPTFVFSEGPGNYAVQLRVNTKGLGGSRQMAVSDPVLVGVKGASFNQFYNLANVAVTCVECHTGTSASGDLILTGSPKDIVNLELKNKPSHNTGLSTCNALIVKPGDAVNSVMYDIFLDPAGGERIFNCAESMRGNLPPGIDPDDALELLRSWILAGAITPP